MTEVDTKYDPDDDSSDEEAIRVRRERTEAKVAKEAADAEIAAAEAPQKGGKKK